MPPLRPILRALARRPGFTVLAVLTIALGIGANATIFGIASGVLLRPLPFEAPEELVTLDVVSPQGYYISLSVPNYRDWRDRNRVFESFGASAGWTMTRTGGERAEVVRGRLVLGEFFRTLGVDPALGRAIPAAETGPGAEPAAVLGHGFWERAFGGDPEVLGRTVVLDRVPYTVVGVMPEGFSYGRTPADVFVPMGVLERLPWEDRESSFGARAVARLGPGVTLAGARRDMERVTAEVATDAGEEVARAEVRPLSDLLLGDVRGRIWLAMGAVAFVLMIACANVANLLLARSEARRREIAVRQALGAGRGRIAGLVLAESLALAAVGGALGLGLAWAGLRAARPLLPGGIPEVVLARVGLDLPVVLFTAGLVVATALVFGLAPALRASRRGLADELREGGRTSAAGRSRLRSGLVVAQVALSLVLLVGAALTLASLDRLRSAEKGFTAEGVLTARVPLEREDYPTQERWRAFYRDLLARASRIPGVRSAAVSLLLPLSDRSWEMGILPADVPYDPDEARSVLFGVVSEDYFRTLGVPILRGRGFRPTDRGGTPPVAVIDETMAERFWPGQDPLGKRITVETAPGSTHENPIPLYRTVVGVARNVRHYELASPSRIQVYLPFEQTGDRWGMDLYVLLRAGDRGGEVGDVGGPGGQGVGSGSGEGAGTAGRAGLGGPVGAAEATEAAALAEPLRREVAALDPEVPLQDLRPLSAYVSDELSGSRATGGVLAVFAGLALLLAAVGLFGVMSYLVARRRRELGIRMALGARAADVVREVGLGGLRLAGLGVVLGLAAAAALARLLQGFLYGVRPLEPGLYLGVAAFLTLVAGAAVWVPARRATRVDPAEVLREEA